MLNSDPLLFEHNFEFPETVGFPDVYRHSPALHYMRQGQVLNYRYTFLTFGLNTLYRLQYFDEDQVDSQHLNLLRFQALIALNPVHPHGFLPLDYNLTPFE